MNNPKKKNCKDGYMALMAILIISFILLSVVITTGFEGFWSLSNVLSRESKEISSNLAESCLDQAIVSLIQSPSWQPKTSGTRIYIGEYSCLIRSVVKEAPRITIESVGESNKSFTILRAVFNEQTLKIETIEELGE